MHAQSVNPEGQNGPSRIGNHLLDALARLRFNQQRNTTSASRAADLSCKRALLAPARDDRVDNGCGDRRQVAAAKNSFFSHEPGRLVPSVLYQRFFASAWVHGGDPLQIAKNGFVAFDVPLEDFPVVDGGLPRLSRVAENRSRFSSSARSQASASRRSPPGSR